MPADPVLCKGRWSPLGPVGQLNGLLLKRVQERLADAQRTPLHIAL